MTKVRLKGYLYIIPFLNGFLIRSESDNEVFIIKGKKASSILSELIPLLNGCMSEDEIIEHLKNYDPQYVRKVLNHLKEKKIIEIVPPITLSNEEISRYSLQLLFFSHFDNLLLQDALKKSKVAIIGLGDIGSQILTSLTLSGIGEIIGIDWNKVTKDNIYQTEFYQSDDINKVRAEACSEKIKNLNPFVHYTPVSHEIREKRDVLPIVEDLDFLVVSFDQENSSILRLINDLCLTSKTPWSNCYIEGFKGVIGPTIIPHQTACYTCYEIRLSANIRHYKEYLAYKKYRENNDKKMVKFGKLNAFSSIVANLMSIEVIKFLTDIRPLTTYGKILTIDFFTMDVEVHSILRFPRCPKCGIDARNMPGERVWCE